MTPAKHEHEPETFKLFGLPVTKKMRDILIPLLLGALLASGGWNVPKFLGLTGGSELRAEVNQVKSELAGCKAAQTESEKKLDKIERKVDLIYILLSRGSR